jgi:cyclopropane-fatty-acyl-phospholipid synthase
LKDGQSTVGGASVEAIRRHYDIGNDFYSLWLDPSLTYSAALWEGKEDLFTAQMNKIDWHLDALQLRADGSLLDIGCGWGAVLHRAMQRYKLKRAVGLTLSEAQVEWIQRKQWPGVEVCAESWADHVVDNPYDAIVSIGAFEHFARLDQQVEQKLASYRHFFEFCHGALQPGGMLSLQSIIYENADRADFSPFFADKVFPESDLPHLFEIVRAADRLFEIEMIRNDRHHYAETVRRWLANLRRHRAEATALAGKGTVARYEKFLGMMVVAFSTGTMNLTRVRMRRLGRRQ